jgi:hypothetical protein
MTDPPGIASPVTPRRSYGKVTAMSIVAVAVLGVAAAGHLHNAPAAPPSGSGGIAPAAPGPEPMATASFVVTLAPSAPPKPTRTPTAAIYTPPPAPTGVDRQADPVAASAQAQHAAHDAILAWLHSDSDETTAQRRARLVGLFTPGNSILTESAPLLEDAAAHSRGDGKIASLQATATEPTTATGEYLVAFEWSMAWWPDTHGLTGVLAGDTTAVVKVSYVAGRWLAASIEWAGANS